MLALAAAPVDDLGFTVLYSSVKPRIDALLAAVNVLNGDVSAWYRQAPKTTAADVFANAWSTWRDTFYGYYKYATDRWVIGFPPLPWTIADEVDKRTIELSAWRVDYERISGQRATGPDPKTAVPPDTGTSIWVYVAVAAVGATVAVIAAKKLAAMSPAGFVARQLVPAAVSGARRR